MSPPQSTRVVLVMGVAGAGKSEVGRALARALGGCWIEADSLHPPENVAKMSGGVPLTDADRAGWLRTIRERIEAALAASPGRPVVVACSALKRGYRGQLLDGLPGVRIVHLSGAFELIDGRLRGRAGHFMPASLLRSQFETLEPPGPDEAPVVVDVTPPLSEVIAAALRGLGGSGP
jgi:carbohydrate kinase (thermoresistant glucokinase family)